MIKFGNFRALILVKLRFLYYFLLMYPKIILCDKREANVRSKNLKVLGGMLLLLSVSAVSANPAKANPAGEKADEPIYISQALGHGEYDGGEQMMWSDYEIGTIHSIVGNAVFYTLEDGSRFVQRGVTRQGINFNSKYGPVVSGSNILIVESERGTPVLYDVGHPMWINALVEDYGFSIAKDKRLKPPLLERTAPIWRSLGVNR